MGRSQESPCRKARQSEGLFYTVDAFSDMTFQYMSISFAGVCGRVAFPPLLYKVQLASVTYFSFCNVQTEISLLCCCCSWQSILENCVNATGPLHCVRLFLNGSRIISVFSKWGRGDYMRVNIIIISAVSYHHNDWKHRTFLLNFNVVKCFVKPSLQLSSFTRPAAVFCSVTRPKTAKH